MQKLLKFVIATSVLASTLPVSIGQAREPFVQKNLASGPNVYRVEIRNMNRFEVLEAGDSDGVGELHELFVELESFNPDGKTQYDGKKFTGTQLYAINKGGIIGGRRNFPIRVGQHVFTARDRRSNNTTQMWVHAYSNPEDTDYNTRPHSLAGVVRLNISAVELDCSFERVCGRKSKGGVSIQFKIPEFTAPPSNRCGPANTFRLEPVDGELQISGLSGTSVSSYANSKTLLLGVDYKKGGPRLQPFNAEICIASTVKPPEIRKPPENASDFIGRNRRPRN